MARLTDTISGAIATFRTPGKQDIRSLKVHFAPVQEGTGDPSPTNVRPISGWTGCEVQKTGKNLLNESLFGSSTSAANLYVQLKPGQTYTFSSTIPQTLLTLATDNTTLSAAKNPYAGHPVTFTTTGTGLIRIRYYNGSQVKLADYNHQIEFGSVSTTYEPYSGTTLPLDWTDSAGTVYGGYVDLVTGEVWETWRLKDLGTVNWTSYSNRAGVFYTAAMNEFSATSKLGVLCNKYASTHDNVTAQTDKTIGDAFQLRARSFAIYDTDYADATVAEFKTAMSGVFAAYPLAEPTLLTTLTPTALRTLIGTNNIWSNANGNVDVEYDFAESREMMEARKRVATFKWKKSRLPAGYREVEYLESRSNPEGMQWPYINTGIGASVNKNTKAEITFHIDCDEAFVFGARYSTSLLMFNINRPSAEGAIRVDIGTNSGGVSKVNYFNHSDTGAYTVHMEYFSASVKRHSDGRVIDTRYTHSISTGVTAPNLYLFAVATGSSSMSCSINNGIIRIMSTKIWEGDQSVLVRDFVPCIRKSDNKAGMYDLVNNVFYPPIYGEFFTNLD